jgi:signal transduction histidine kinase
MTSWAFLGLLDALFFALSLYFFYVFVDGEDISLSKKLLIFIPILPILFMLPTSYNLLEFDLSMCEAVEDKSIIYVLMYEIYISVWIFIIAVNRYFTAVNEKRKEIFFTALGIGIFLLNFYFFVYFANFFGEYYFEQYGLFGMVVFIGIFAYAIVEYKVMDIKLAKAQALVWALIFLIGAQFFFITSQTNRVLNTITLFLVAVMGYYLVKSVKQEAKQNERLIQFSKELTRANTELKRLDNSKSEFISIASHQLRTPLTAIKGYISLILEGAYGQNAEKTDDALNKIFLANERLIQLVEDMLNLTRIESGRLEYHYEDNVQVEDVLKELGDMFILRTKDKGLDFVIDTSDKKLPPIRADKSKFREVISNLIDNAIKYTKEGFIHVSAVQDRNVVRIVVEDSGMGISPESLKTLFTKFSRGTDSTKVYTDGSGLGLYVGKNLIESQGGHIYVESDGVGKGSRFIVEMPIASGKK